MTPFKAYPSIAHLRRVGSASRADKVLDDAEAVRLLSSPVVVEEKIDGENLGLSVLDGRLEAQARGSYVQLDGRHFRGLASWLEPRRSRLLQALSPDLVLFGEWCADSHSVGYTRLPDWLLVFDVFDRRDAVFWSSARRDELARSLGLSTVPLLSSGRCDIDELFELIGDSTFGEQQMEGVVVRQELYGSTSARAKLVRADFAESIGEHWRRGPRRRNRLLVAA